jgi:2-polyprenyl-6-methoxyphenol hydroxylase-like FAD-dependent oxidoreductase
VIDVPVLVVGGGPAGMSMSLLLDRFGIPNMLAEKRPCTTTHPKARGCTARTMEQFRVWGIEERVRKAALPQESDVACWCESLNGPLVAYTQPAPVQNTPAPRAIVPQDAVEEALADELATRSGVQLRRRTEFLSLAQDAEAVTARLRDLDTGQLLEMRARYLIGCDGANSRVRDAVGIEMEGPQTLALMANHFYRADVGHLPHVRSAIGFLVRPRDRSRPELRANNTHRPTFDLGRMDAHSPLPRRSSRRWSCAVALRRRGCSACRAVPTHLKVPFVGPLLLTHDGVTHY